MLKLHTKKVGGGGYRLFDKHNVVLGLTFFYLASCSAKSSFSSIQPTSIKASGAHTENTAVSLESVYACEAKLAEADAKLLLGSLSEVQSKSQVVFRYFVSGVSEPIFERTASVGQFRDEYIVGSSGSEHEKRDAQIFCVPTVVYNKRNLTLPATTPIPIVDGAPLFKLVSGALEQSQFVGAALLETIVEARDPDGDALSLSQTSTCGTDVTVALNEKRLTLSGTMPQLSSCIVSLTAQTENGASATEVLRFTRKLSSSAPTATLSNTPAEFSNSAALNVSVSASGATEYKYTVVKAPASCTSASYSGWRPVSQPISESVSDGDGTYSLCVATKDVTGNTQSVPTVYNWTLDTAAPVSADVHLSGAPSDASKNTTLNITVSGTNLGGYISKVQTSDTCSSDDDYSATTTLNTKITENLSSLADGPIYLCVRGIDKAGNVATSANARKVNWTKDTVGPLVGNLTLAGAPTGTSSATTLDVTVGGTDVASYRFKISSTDCTLDADLSSNVLVATHITSSLASLSDGSLYLCVKGLDTAGNESTAKVANWTKDTSAPTASLSNMPSSFSNTTSLNVSVGGAGVSEYQYALITTGACSSATYSGFQTGAITDALGADGSYTLCVKGKDASGNVQTTATSHSWTKDIVAPSASDISLSSVPTATNNTASLNISVSGVTSYRYKLSETNTCANDADYSGSDIAIATSITDNIASLNDGSIFLCVRAKDAAGNLTASADAKVATWTKDTEAPTALDISLTNAPTGTNSVTVLDVTVSGVSSYRYKIATTNTCTTDSGYSGSDILTSTKITNNISGLADGSIFLCIRAKDTVGNLTAAADAKVVSWTKDTLGATASLSGQPTSSSNATSLSVTVSGADVEKYIFALLGPNSSDTCTNATYTDTASAIAVATLITNGLGADGAYLLCVKGLDAAGNVQSTATSYAWAKDVVAPTATDISLSNLPASPSSSAALDITVGGTGVIGYQSSLTTQATTCENASYGSDTLINTKITDALSNGTLRLCVRGKDAAGNLTAAVDAKAHNWTQDNNEPQAAHIALAGSPTSRSNVTPLAITVSADASWTHSSFTHTNYALVPDQVTACDDVSVIYNGWNASASVAPNVSTEGNKRLCILVRTASGKETAKANAKVFDWVFDTTAPVANDIALIGTPSDPSNVAALNVTVSANASADVVKYKFALTTQATACGSLADGAYSASWLNEGTSITDNVGASGTRRLCVMAQDLAGNSTKANAKHFDWTQDADAPTVTLVSNVSPTTLSSPSTQASLTFKSNEVGTYEVIDNTDSGNLVTVKSGSVATADSDVIVNFYSTDLLAGDGTHTLSLRVLDVAGNARVTSLNNVTVISLKNLAVNFYHDGTNQSQHKLQWESGLDSSSKIKIVRAVDTTTPPSTVGGGTLIATLDGDKLIHTFNGVTNNQVAFSLFVCDNAGNNCIYSAGTSYNKTTVIQNDSESNVLKVRFSGNPGGSTVRIGYSKNKADIVAWDGVSATITDGAGATCASSPCSVTFSNDTTHPAWTKLYYKISTTTSGGVTSFSEMGYWAKVPPGMVFVSKEDWPVEFTGHNYLSNTYDGISGPFDYAIDKYEVYLASGSLSTNSYPNSDTGVLKSASGQTPGNQDWFDLKQGCENRTTDADYASYVGNTRKANAGATFQNPRVRVHLTTDAEWMVGAFQTKDVAGAGNCNTDSRGSPFTAGNAGTTNCISRYGVMDMIGNVWEWTDAHFNNPSAGNGTRTTFYGTGASFPYTTSLSNIPNSTTFSYFDFSTMYPATSGTSGNYFGDYSYFYAGNPLAALRGGAWGNGAGAGRFILYVGSAPTVVDASIGGRCALVFAP